MMEHPILEYLLRGKENAPEVFCVSCFNGTGNGNTAGLRNRANPGSDINYYSVPCRRLLGVPAQVPPFDRLRKRVLVRPRLLPGRTAGTGRSECRGAVSGNPCKHRRVLCHLRTFISDGQDRLHERREIAHLPGAQKAHLRRADNRFREYL